MARPRRTDEQLVTSARQVVQQTQDIRELRQALAVLLQLKALGVQPDKVKHVIATHMHWDHAGNYDLFPNARYHIQDTEIGPPAAACAIRCCACRSARATCTP